jgi:hypothetical protein
VRVGRAFASALSASSASFAMDRCHARSFKCGSANVSVGQDDAAIRRSRRRPYILVSMATSRYPRLRKMLKLAYFT